ncbi:MAG: 23S rRNA (uracil(1939)-C(5))-methyltransferase RlmD [Eubacteriales bacterium]
MSDIKKNDIIEVDITAVSNLGYGVGRTDDGKVVFTPGTVTGERARVKIIKITKGYLVGKLLDIIAESPLRDYCPKCSAPATCGGCAYRFIDYDHELELKTQNVVSEFSKVGLADVKVLDTACVRDENGNAVVWHYRNKAQYRFAKDGEHISAGFYASGTHRVIGNEACPLQPVIFGEITRLVCDFAEKHNISVYDEEKGKGLLRHLYIRSGAGAEGEICVCIVINAKTLPHADELADKLRNRFERIVGVVLNVNTKNSNLILGDEYITVSGKCGITDTFCGVELDVSPAAFYQVNHDAAQMLCGIAADKAQLTGNEHLLDLYCGIGSVGLSMAHKVRKLTGVEIVPQAVECAIKNAERAGIENSRFICADSAAGAADILAMTDELPDVVVLDPPRKGCASELLDSLTQSGIRRIVYISCNPATLARDCAYLSHLGWNIGEVQPVDLFPRTGHVETVVCLFRK